MLLAELMQRSSGDPAHHAAVASACFAVGDLPEAETWIRRALASDPQSSDFMTRLGAILHAQGRLEDALDAYRDAAAADPECYDAWMGMGSCELDRRNPAEAEAHFRQALAVDASHAAGWTYLGVALDRQGDGEAARPVHERAVAIEAGSGEAYLGLAASLRDEARFADAMTLLASRSRRSPDANVLYSHLLLGQGRYSEGWRLHEYRWMTDHFLERRRHSDKPAWDGQDLQGRTVLLRAEQGMGDTLQFARYAMLVKRLGARVWLAVPRELSLVATRVHGVDGVCALGSDEDAVPFDYHVPLMSLPRIFGTEVATIPASVPYLDRDTSRDTSWAARFARDGPALKVGVAFAGNPQNLEDRFRSMSLHHLAPLGSLVGVRFYSLQKGARERDARTPPMGLDIVDLAPEIEDFADTAAVIANLDLVISVCTSVAHLAGALGTPLWVLLHRAADWRWLVDRTDSPWYPTARLFRQRTRGDWPGVVADVRAALAHVVASGASLVPTPRTAMTDPTVPGRMPWSPVVHTRMGIVEHFPDDGAVAAGLAYYGEWQRAQVELLGEIVGAGSAVVEVGAGVGARTLDLSRLVGPTGLVIAIEPREAYRRVLRRNVAANVAANVTVVRDPVPTIDGLHLDSLDWITVTNAGVVASALDGAADTLWRLRPRIFACVDEVTVEPALRRLQLAGYRCWKHESTLFDVLNFNRRTDDIFGGRTALALVAIPEEATDAPALSGCSELA